MKPYYDDPRNALLTRLSQSGQPEEVPLPADPDDPVSSQQDSHLRLIRIPLRVASRSESDVHSWQALLQPTGESHHIH